MKKILQILSIAFCFTVLLWLTSCVSVPKKDGLNRVFVTNNKLINVLSPDFFGKEIDDTALLKISIDNETYSLMAYVQSNREGIFLSLMNDFMVEMGYLYYDGKSVDLDCLLLPSKLKGEYIVNDLQNAFYNEYYLEENLVKSKLGFKQVVENDVIYRYILDNSKIIEKIEINQNMVCVVNYLRNYQYSLLFEQPL